MWTRWFPWRFIVRQIALAKGFSDPMKILAQLENFAKPSEVMAPVELLRLAVVLHARGLMNSQAIQHNLDWIWPYWVVRQFDPRDRAFIPRAFSLTHINLTHRNWTAAGLPDSSDYPIVDPRGLVTPFYDGWSLDSWIVSDGRDDLIPSKLASVSQTMLLNGNLSVETLAAMRGCRLRTRTEMFREKNHAICRLAVKGRSEKDAWLAISLRPYNPEGVSFIHKIAPLKDSIGWNVDGSHSVYFNETPDEIHFSIFSGGDVYRRLFAKGDTTGVSCNVGMATAAALFKIKKGTEREVVVQVPVGRKSKQSLCFDLPVSASETWENALRGSCRLQTPDSQFGYLYETALRTVILYSPGEVYAGPFTYKHFWFRDAVFILHALLAAGLFERAERILDAFPARQGPSGYFRSQDGEWDSNGQVLWILNRFREWTGKMPEKHWTQVILKAGDWILRKRLPSIPEKLHAGLFPPGFSAEHLGPNNYYYWDDFWGVAGLRAAADLLSLGGHKGETFRFREASEDFLKCIERSITKVAKQLGYDAIPASPYRRMDSGAIGSLAAGYPLHLWDARDPRLLATVEYLLKECFVEDGFFHNMSHSGINPYLTLHVAQVLLRAGDERYWNIVKRVAMLASPTGQWPEAIHPQIGGGCMGDGQHAWASAEWILMTRALFLREENGKLILCPGIPAEWLHPGKEISFGPAPTSFGTIHIGLHPLKDKINVSWKADWRHPPNSVEVKIPHFSTLGTLKSEARPAGKENTIEVSRRGA